MNCEVAAEQGGRRAFCTGLSLAFNPFDESSDEHAAWIKGWVEAKVDLPEVVERVRESLPSAEEVAEIIAVPLAQWPGNCFGIASLLVSEGVVPGTVAYGNYHGPISRDSVFGQRTIPPHHAWVRTVEGVIVDPTAWAFLMDDFTITVTGVSDKMYDEGGVRFRKLLRPVQPCPAGDGCDRVLKLPEDLVDVVARISEGRTADDLTKAQAFWLANLGPDALGFHASAIYRWLDDQGMIGLVPIDHRTMVRDFEQSTSSSPAWPKP